MPERLGFNPEGKIGSVDFPYKLKNVEAVDLISELLSDERIAGHLDFLRKHHAPSYEHSVRVGTLSTDLCIENHLQPEETKLVGAGGLLHDLGKCYIPLEVLAKNSPLTKEEMDLMRTHARKGFERLIDPAFDGIREIVASHHEHQNNPYPRNGNGNGKPAQPNRRNGEKKIYERAAIVAAADIFDALASHRPYNQEYSFKEIEQIIHEKYTGDPKLIEQILNRYKEQE
ncbi:MAG: HD domain-containing phosphohydrolase [Patescibacteria group bacterium]|jgi:putative nucleotidyltransferase with HDIG domain